MNTHTLEQSPLGKVTHYTDRYEPSLLFPILRTENRQTLGIRGSLPFKGIDLWNGYELSWLNAKGKPIVALAQFLFSCESDYLIESKSFKLYLNSLVQTAFPGTDAESFTAVKNILTKDLSGAVNADVVVELASLDSFTETFGRLSGQCLDSLDVTCSAYQPHPDYLHTENTEVNESVYSHLLKSNCPITGQPDWGSVHIEYQGKKINHAGLLQYLISFRQNNEFHEHCVERIFTDIMQRCQPSKLTVGAFYTRRGGLDINPLRSTENLDFAARYKRLSRQ